MGLYEGIKDIAKVVQKADNIELYTKLLDLCQEAQDLQEENRKLRNEIEDLKKKESISSLIVRHTETYITLSNDKQELRYCSHCWDSEKKLIQLVCNDGKFRCPHCKMSGYYDKEQATRNLRFM